MLAYLGETVPIYLTLSDGASDQFPQAKIYDSSGVQVGSTLNLTYVAGSPGLYRTSWTTPTLGMFEVVYTVFSDSGHTTISSFYDRAADSVDVLTSALGDSDTVIRQAFTLDTSSNNITVLIWLETNAGEALTGVSTGTVTVYRADGTILLATATQASPIAQGVFRFTFVNPGFAVGETGLFALATIVYAGPPSRTVRGVMGVTVSRGV